MLPAKLRQKALTLSHERHLGIVGTKQNLHTKIWWPGYDKATEKFVRSCHGCQLVAKPDPAELIMSTVLPDGPYQDLAFDLLGPLPSGHSLLVQINYYNWYYKVDIMMPTTACKVIDCLEEHFSHNGISMTIRSDNGPQFKS